MPSSERRRQYRTALRTARDLGVSDFDIAEVIVALGPNAEVDDLEAALMHGFGYGRLPAAGVEPQVAA